MPRRPCRPMLCLVAFLFSSSALANTQTDGEPSPPVVTLSEAVRLALLFNDRVISADESVQQADLSVSLAQSEFGLKVEPSVLGSFGQTDISNQSYNLNVSRRFSTGTELRSRIGTTTFQNQIGNFYNGETTFELSQPLLRGFGRTSARRGLDAAESRARTTDHQRTLTAQQIGLDVAAAYYGLIAQAELVDIARSTLESSRQLLEASEAKLAAGLVSRLDVLRAQQLVGEAEGRVFDALAAVEDTSDQLRLLMGRDTDFQFTPERHIPETVDPVLPEVAAELALANRLELTDARAALEDSERGVRYTRNRLLPQLDVNVALTRRETAEHFGEAFGFDNFEVATFLAASMPLDRPTATAALNNAIIERGRQLRRVDLLRRQIEAEARRAARQQERLVRNLALADARVELAEQEAELSMLRFQRGLSNNLDLVNAESNLLNARGQRLAITAGLASSRLSLLAAMGILDPRRDIE